MQPLVISDGLLPADSCFSQSYLGTFAGQSLYLPAVDCALESAAALDLDVERFVGIPAGTTELVWVNEMALDDELLDELKQTNPWGYMDEQLNNILKTVAAETRVFQGGQRVLEDPAFPAEAVTLYRTPTVSLLALRGLASSAFALDAVLAPIHKATVISYPPVPFVPVPEDDLARIRTLLSTLKYDRNVARLVNVLSITQMHSDITWLTGEATGSPIESRHSFHPDTIKAAKWIKTQIEGTGASSTQVFERAGPIVDPMYHNSGDLSDRIGYDLEQAKSIAKVQFATLLHAAGFSLYA
ncbi:hypothetical protein M0805_008475 [Coniferiporia weirii]|nr:hypothetical protein M0805_008475 [Coniferiporia weirii]